MLDEVDKIGMDFRGDPSSALLEVLDPNRTFPSLITISMLISDLSKVMFITTANVLDTIPPPLRDRMETLELPGYSEDQKMMIAKQFLIPKQISEHGLSSAVHRISGFGSSNHHQFLYPRGGGQNLEREVAAICRGVAKDVAREIKEKVSSFQTTCINFRAGQILPRSGRADL